MLKTLMDLCALSGVSGHEDEVREYLKVRALPCADSVRVDTMGNLIVFKRGRKHTEQKLLLSAHMDEVGLMIHHITDEGYLKFDTVGGIDRRVLLGKHVVVGDLKVPGVIGLKAYHLVSAEEEKRLPKQTEFYIDIGARNRAMATEQVKIGDVAVFQSECVEFGDSMLKAKAIDDRIGCAILLEILKDP
ncbi:MAG: M42 family peptidase, partial [Evtepia sp.]